MTSIPGLSEESFRRGFIPALEQPTDWTAWR